MIPARADRRASRGHLCLARFKSVAYLRGLARGSVNRDLSARVSIGGGGSVNLSVGKIEEENIWPPHWND